MWIFENAVLVNIEDTRLEGVPFHYNCYRILNNQEEDMEYFKEVNLNKKNEHLIKSKTNNNKNYF